MTVSPAVLLSGADREEGTQALIESGYGLCWFARSKFLAAGCDTVAPWLCFQPSGEPDVLPAGGAARTVVLGFRVDDMMLAWAARHGATLAMPPPGLTARLGDKTRLPAITREAGVGVPQAVVRRSVSALDAGALWDELGAGLGVVQLAENDLTGAGTRRVGDAAELAAILENWAGRDVKLAEYVEGVPITVSAVVTRDTVIVSGVSYQIVGYPELTPLWAAHCGNQLIGDTQLPPGMGTAARQACLRVGAVLRRAGFRGMLGIDVIATCDRLVVLEINPRVQSVSSLLNAAELDAGLLPSPLLHALSFLPGSVVPPAHGRSALPPFGHLVVSAQAPGKVTALPAAGAHVLTAAAPGSTVTGQPAPLGSLRSDEALVWPMTAAGAAARRADRLYAVQTPGPVVTCPGGVLTETALRWLDALSQQTRIEGAAA
jgi:ATP-grasp domain